MKQLKKILFFLTSYFFIIAFSVTAMSPIPYQFENKRKKYIAEQISHDNKLFLRRLSKAFGYFADINQANLKILETAFPKGEKRPKRMLKHLSKFANVAINTIEGKQGLFRNDKKFINYFFTKDIQLKKELNKITNDYQRIKNIDLFLGSEPKSNTYIEGAYRYYQLRIKYIVSSQKKNPVRESILKSIKLFDRLSELPLKYHVEDVKKSLLEYNRELEGVAETIANEIIHPLEVSNRTWTTKLIIEIMNLCMEQIKLNQYFSKSILKRMEKIPTPNKPKLPDLKVTSIKFKLPDNTSTNSVITIIGKVKNIGDIKSPKSKALIIFPNNVKRGKTIPALKPDTSYTLKWKYKIRKKGKNDFIIKANYKYHNWESNTSNNTTSRALIVN